MKSNASICPIWLSTLQVPSAAIASPLWALETEAGKHKDMYQEMMLFKLLSPLSPEFLARHEQADPAQNA